MEQNNASEANTSSAIQEITSNSLPFLKLPATFPYTEPDNPCLRPPKPFPQYPF
jgi:hypothetical protein